MQFPEHWLLFIAFTTLNRTPDQLGDRKCDYGFNDLQYQSFQYNRTENSTYVMN